MLFARTLMGRLSVVGLSCRDFALRVAVVLFLSVSVVSAMADPVAQFALATDLDDAAEVVVAITGDLDPEKVAVRLAADKIPDFRFDDLRAERLASSHDWRVSFAFEARGPPV